MGPAKQAVVDFERDIRPIFSSRCLKCHGADEPQADLNLTGRATAVDSGAVTPGSLADSALWERVNSEDASLRMPPDGEPLSDQERRLLRRWIESGAEWPDHWAYRPLRANAPPSLASPVLRGWRRTPIDDFVARRWEEAGLTPSPPASPAVWLRRASFDLRGLPPTAQEIDELVRDSAPAAWERAVDRLLASPAYGERWARRWMDLVHFAETHGHDQDRPREHAWPYRDYLIRSFNDDLPYDRFLRQQIAGDVLEPDNPLAIAATGFLAAGPWDESSLRDIREDSLDRLIGQYLDRDDIVTTVMSTFASTSVHCARCHDHKFDPISQEEYYGLQAVFAGVDKANRPYDADPTIARRRRELQGDLKQLESRFAAAPESLLTEEALAAAARWEQGVRRKAESWRPAGILESSSRGGAELRALEDGSLLVSGSRPEKDVYVVRASFPLRRVTAVRLEVLPDASLPAQGPGRAENGNLHLNEIRLQQILSEPQGAERRLQLAAPTADFNQEGWTIAAAVDGDPNTAWGIYPEVGRRHEAVFPLVEAAASPEDEVRLEVELQQIHGGSHLIGRFRLSATDADAAELQQAELPPPEVAEILAIAAEQRTAPQQARLVHWRLRRGLQEQLDALPPQQLVYSGTNTFQAEGSFRPATEPRSVHVLERGLATSPGEEAAPAALSCWTEGASAFQPEQPEDEGSRRAALAEWLAHPRNPLVWRSIANRVWQAHFGRGLVDTPNDFGRMGSPPTHPQLLDWLAWELRDHGGSLKHLHRVILTSATYRQSWRSDPACEDVDADNRLLWRMPRRRLDAESFRDAALQAAGALDRTMHGPSVRQFIQTPGAHVTPEVDYQNFDIDAPANYRRGVYRFLFRTIPDPFMEALDCPDASQLTPRRNTSLTALQALATLNDKLVVRQSELLAERLQQTTPDQREQVRQAFLRLLNRPPAEHELQAVRQYADRHGLANACRMLLNTNEFLFVD